MEIYTALGDTCNHQTPNTLAVNGKSADSDEGIANMFNDYFINLAKALLADDAEYTQALDILKNFTETKLDSSNILSIKPIDETSIFTMFTKLNVHESSWVDCQRPSNKLVNTWHALNLLLVGSFLEVTPIYKNGDRILVIIAGFPSYLQYQKIINAM